VSCKGRRAAPCPETSSHPPAMACPNRALPTEVTALHHGDNCLEFSADPTPEDRHHGLLAGGCSWPIPRRPGPHWWRGAAWPGGRTEGLAEGGHGPDRHLCTLRHQPPPFMAKDSQAPARHRDRGTGQSQPMSSWGALDPIPPPPECGSITCCGGIL
jgi:hypothetical protein